MDNGEVQMHSFDKPWPPIINSYEDLKFQKQVK